MSSEQTAPDEIVEVEASQTAEPEAQSEERRRREEEQRRLEDQISATLNNIQLSRGVDDIIEGDFTEEDVEQLADVLDGCDGEYKNLFATLDQLGSCLDEVENRNDTLNSRVDDLLQMMESSHRDREQSLKNWTQEANKVMDDLNRLQNDKNDS